MSYCFIVLELWTDWGGFESGSYRTFCCEASSQP